MSLANKYRPTTFDAMVGQENVLQTIKNECETGSIAQCILLCGPAGTGKTTTARIIANQLDAEVHELDAASNNGIDYIRIMQEQANKKSMTNTNKVFILDEVHGLSSQSWQAMLKLLEEPPKHTYFILCTTEHYKIPQTILSRVQKFYFSAVVDAEILSYLQQVCKCENIIADEDALQFIVKKSNGCVRDALSMLDVASSFADKITLRSCVDALNEVSPIYIIDFVNAICEGHKQQAIRIVKDVEHNGLSVKQFIRSCIYEAIDCCEKFIFENDTNMKAFLIKKSCLDFLMQLNKDMPKSDMQAARFVEANIILRGDDT